MHFSPFTHISSLSSAALGNSQGGGNNDGGGYRFQAGKIVPVPPYNPVLLSGLQHAG